MNMQITETGNKPHGSAATGQLILLTAKAKSWMTWPEADLVAQINGCLNATTLKDDLKADIKSLHQFYLNMGHHVDDGSVTRLGVGKLVAKEVTTEWLEGGDGDFEALVAGKYLQVKRSAMTRKIQFSLTLKDVRKLLKQKYCKYTGIEMGGTKEYRLTFDRIDNTKGYVPGNVVACTEIANKMKNHLTEFPAVQDALHPGEIAKMLRAFARVQDKLQSAENQA